MNVSRQIALEIFGLTEGFTQEELNKHFKRLSKIVHPDTGGDENLFKFINCCKKILLDDSKTNNTRKSHEEPTHSESKSNSNKKSVYTTLSTLYDIYYDLDSYTKEYNITHITGMAQVFIIPCKNKKYCESKIIEFSQPFREFQNLNFANFSTTLKLPENLKKFKKFKIRVEFMKKTFDFKLSMNKPFHIIKYEEINFNSIIELTFE